MLNFLMMTGLLVLFIILIRDAIMFLSASMKEGILSSFILDIFRIEGICMEQTMAVGISCTLFLCAIIDAKYLCPLLLRFLDT